MVHEAQSCSLDIGRKPKRRRHREWLIFYLLISPWIIGFLVFLLYPMISSFYYSLTIWDMLSPPKFCGFDNYKYALFHDSSFWQALKVTTIYSVITVPLYMVLSLALALMLHTITKGKRIFRTIYYLPAIVGGVPVMILWSFIFSPNMGLLNEILGIFGIKGVSWLYDSRYALFSLILMGTWSVGGGMIIWLAGLNGVPQAIYDAALVDGAGMWRTFFKITLPMISPTIFFNLVTGVIGAFQSFTQSFVMTGGGPDESTLFYNLYLWQNAFDFYDMGYASALAWILFVIVLALTMLIFRFSSAWVYYEGEVK